MPAMSFQKTGGGAIRWWVSVWRGYWQQVAVEVHAPGLGSPVFQVGWKLRDLIMWATTSSDGMFSIRKSFRFFSDSVSRVPLCANSGSSDPWDAAQTRVYRPLALSAGCSDGGHQWDDDNDVVEVFSLKHICSLPVGGFLSNTKKAGAMIGSPDPGWARILSPFVSVMSLQLHFCTCQMHLLLEVEFHTFQSSTWLYYFWTSI